MDLLKLIQMRVAQIAIGASTLRNQGARNVVANTRKFLMRVDLDHFNVNTSTDFRGSLDKETKNLRNALPIGARHWGTARKALNIFLRDALYNRYLCDEYRFISRLEPWLELPLDGEVARGLLAESEGRKLTRWQGVKHLTPAMSDDYQKFAEHVAQRRHIARIHLDLIYWRRSKDDGQMEAQRHAQIRNGACRSAMVVIDRQ